jgi:hypothetical protein
MPRSTAVLLMLCIGPAHTVLAEARRVDIPIVKVRLERTASGFTYHYRIVHSSSQRLPAITGLDLGHDMTTPEPKNSALDVEPMAVSSPPGWSHDVTPSEEIARWVVGWSGSNNGITLGHEQCAFSVTLPRESSAYANGPYTLFLSANWFGGVLEPDDSTAPCLSAAPTIQLTAPAEGASLSGVVDVVAEASDETAVLGVCLTVDGEGVGDEVTAPPYSFRWDTSTVTRGPHVVGAIARDADGNGARATVNVTVGTDTKPPPRGRGGGVGLSRAAPREKDLEGALLAGSPFASSLTR